MQHFSHTINIAAKRSGLSAHVIRVWEKRYNGVAPTRTATNRRLYTDADIERLCLLKRATDLGHRIAHIADLNIAQLKQLLAADESLNQEQPPLPPGHSLTRDASWNPNTCVQALMHAIRALDMDTLERHLKEAVLKLGHQGMLCHVVAPLTKAMGDAWQTGEITIAHEHAATTALKTFLFSSAKPFTASVAAPRLVVVTPPGQMHELGSVMVAALATNLGWRSVYLGASVPAAEIAGAVQQNNATALAISLVYPHGDLEAMNAMRQIRGFLPSPFPILVGGQAQPSYQSVTREIDALLCSDLDEVQKVLNQLQNTAP